MASSVSSSDQGKRRESHLTSSDNDCGLCAACRRIFEDTSDVRHDMSIDPQDPKDSTGETPIFTREVLSGGHWADPDSCKLAAHGGCMICHIVWERCCMLFDQILTFTGGTQMRIWRGYFTEYQVRPWYRRRGKRQMDHVPKTAWVLEITFESIRRVNSLPVHFDATECMVEFLLLPTQDRLPDFEPRQCSLSTGSAECWTLLRNWLNTCTSSHSLCKAVPSEAPFCPTRLLEVVTVNDSEVVIKLCENGKPRMKYIALSHRWGQNMLVLEDDNFPSKFANKVSLENLRSGVQVYHLSATFQDAIASITQLGVHHIWIDALCIIQNSSADWDKESVQMHNVYGSAFCTLAATSSADGSEPLLYDRHAGATSFSEILPSWNFEHKDLDDLPRERIQIIPLDFWRANVHDAALNRRGWVFQERLLSQRVIHFGRMQLFWECMECDWCETFSNGLPPLLETSETRLKGSDKDRNGGALMNHGSKRLTERPDGINSSSSAEDAPEAGSSLTSALASLTIESSSELTGLEGYFLWSRALEKYCTTRLTYGKDKLLAISGLAKRMETVLDDLCFSGLWKTVMPSQLLWRVNNYHSTQLTIYKYADTTNEAQRETQKPRQVYAHRPEQYRAPSWSWASIDGAITTSYPSLDQGFIRCIGAKRMEQQAHEGGLPLVTHLMLEGALHLGYIEYQTMVQRWQISVTPQGIRMKRPGESAASPMVSLDPDPALVTNTPRFTMGIAYPDVEMSIGARHRVLCLPVLRSQKRLALTSDMLGTETSRISGLMLDLGSDSEIGAHRRIGVFDLLGDDLITDKFCCAASFRSYFDHNGNIILI